MPKSGALQLRDELVEPDLVWWPRVDGVIDNSHPVAKKITPSEKLARVKLALPQFIKENSYRLHYLSMGNTKQKEQLTELIEDFFNKA